MADDRPVFLGVDVGTTHVKAALFEADGRLLSGASRPNLASKAPGGWSFYVADSLWETICAVVRESLAGVDGRVTAVGITGMAESGLLLNRVDGKPRSLIIPWFDQSAAPQAARLMAGGDPLAQFTRKGIYPSFKCSLAKVLWLRETQSVETAGAAWLGVPEWAAFRLTGEAAADASLAGRTYAFRLDTLAWDIEALESLGLPADLFAKVLPNGTPVGVVLPEAAAQTGLPAGIPVMIAGHDHVCAALAAGAVDPGLVFDSMGTAETLIGALDAGPLDEAAYHSGLSYGRHTGVGRMYWMAGLSTSGGSVEWLRALLGDPPLSYQTLEKLLQECPCEPTGILYFPYLAGSGAPHTDPAARAAFVGLTMRHSRGDLARAVLEGAAYEMEFARRTAQAASGAKVERIIAAGGGTHNRAWMQIKADVTGCIYEAPVMPEAALRGAALQAGIGSGFYAGEREALAAMRPDQVERYEPNEAAHAAYQEIFEQGFLPLQEPLRRYSNTFEKR